MDALKNAAYSLVATAPSPASSGTSLVVTAGEGARFPAAPFNAVVWAAGAQPLWAAGGATGGNFEIVTVTAVSTDTLTITRAQESTTARSIMVGDQIAQNITAKTLTDIEAAIGTTLICDQLLSGNQASFDTNTLLGGNIPATYKHLRAILVGRSSAAATADTPILRLNNDSGSNYDYQRLDSSGASTPSGSANQGQTSIQVGAIGAASGPASTFGLVTIDIPNYADTTGFKTLFAQGGLGNSGLTLLRLSVGEWRSTSAIIRVAITLSTGPNFVAGSRFSLYGVA